MSVKNVDGGGEEETRGRRGVVSFLSYMIAASAPGACFKIGYKCAGVCEVQIQKGGALRVL